MILELKNLEEIQKVKDNIIKSKEYIIRLNSWNMSIKKDGLLVIAIIVEDTS